MYRQVEQRGGRERSDPDVAVWGRNGFGLQALGGHARHGHYAAVFSADFHRPWLGDGLGACSAHMLCTRYAHVLCTHATWPVAYGPYGAHVPQVGVCSTYTVLHCRDHGSRHT
jgi:hypothetical protein